MPVAIVGMHRSGTSMVAHMLSEAALYLGPRHDLFPASRDNLDGYWEHIGFHRVNESVLAELGGGWDSPPPVPERWRDDARLRPFADEAKRLIGEFDGKDPWGWKDPRTSLTLALWRDLIPNLRVVLCVRNPLEVALSLNRRGMSSYSTGLALWRTYNERILDASSEEHLIVTDYSAYFARPRVELGRILSLLGITVPPKKLEVAAAVHRGSLRHTRCDLNELSEARVAPNIVELYTWLKAQAGERTASARAVKRPATGRGTARVVDERAVDAELTRRRVLALEEEVGRLHELAVSGDEALSRARTREADLAREIEFLRERVDGQERLIQQLSDIHESFYMLETAILENSSAGAAYANQLQRIKEIVRHETPVGTSLAVVSRGDELLRGLYGRRVLHFPQTYEGIPAGHHPASGLAAVAHLEVLRARGTDYFLLPATEFWWLEHYPDLRRHLTGRYREVIRENGACALFALRGRLDARTRWRRKALDLASAVRSERGRSPSVLDWDSGLELVDALPGTHAVTQVTETGSLPFPEGSVDVVALAQRAPGAVSEAERVASAAVIALPAAPTGDEEPELRLKQIPRSALELSGVSMVIPCRGDAPDVERCLASLGETLPREFGGEIILVDDASPGATADVLRRFATTHDRATVVENPTGADPLEAANLGASAASADTLVFLGGAILPLPGWLRPLLDPLREHPHAGAVGGRLLFPDGSLEEAGGTIFRDGSALRFGHGEADPEAALFDYVRKVDYCSHRLLATPRRLFLELGGFDKGYVPGVFADVDYCFSLRQHGMDVYFQPMSTAVQLEGARAEKGLLGSGRSQGPPDPRFVTRWRSILKDQPARPEVLDMDALRALAAARAEG
jgi:GT2 family glycosyltransferase